MMNSIRASHKEALDDLKFDVAPAGIAKQSLGPVEVEGVYYAVEYVVIVILA